MPRKATEAVVEADPPRRPPPREEQDVRRPLQQGAHVDTTLPSSAYETRIVDQLQLLLNTSQVDQQESVKMGRIAAGALFFHQGIPVGLTFGILLISCVLYPSVQTIACTVLFFVLYAFCMGVQIYLLWARITEKKMHTACVMRDVLERWRQRIAGMMKLPRQSPHERRAAFLESTGMLPAKAFRMVAVIDVTTGRLKHILKCLLMRGTRRLDESKLCAWPYTEPVGPCKLVDAMEMTLKSDPIVLRPLQDKRRPPRRPASQPLGSIGEGEEEEANTTDDSDHERDPRKETIGTNTNSVSQKMEFLVHRVFLLVWVLGMLLTTAAGLIFCACVGVPVGENVFLYPSVALLGLLPVNAILLSRALMLYANVYLERLFSHLVARPMYALDDRVPRFSFLSIWKSLWQVVRQRPGRHLLCFSSSIVEVLGTASVVALLDTTGVVTDMVPLPAVMLMCKRDEQLDAASSSEDEGGNVGSGATSHPHDDKAAAPARSASHRQRRERRPCAGRKKAQNRLFFELQLIPSQREDLAVQFADEQEQEARERNVSPVAHCLLLHALLPEPENLETWTERFRFCDRTVRWARSTHWIARAHDFVDDVADSFRVLARVFQINTKARTGTRNDYPEQSSTLLAVDENGLLHAFTIGTVHMVVHNCSYYFTGASLEALRPAARDELLNTGSIVWEDRMGLETVAVAHMMLPEMYVAVARKHFQCDGDGYAEYFFFNGVREGATTGGGVGHCSSRLRQPQGEEGVRLRSQDAEETVLLQCDKRGQKKHPQRQEAEAEGEAVNRGTSSTTTQAAVDGSSSAGSAGEGGKMASPGGEGSDAVDAPASLESLLDLLVGNSFAFLAFVGLRDSIRPDVENSMSLLDEAGIRCMYFSAENERRTKSFGNRLGLETDWNCCISLKTGAVELDPHSIRAQLPVGIDAIRKHILHVDPIPLQVKMFSHAHSVSTRAMLSILQDNHDVVVSIGSLFNHGNVRSFIQSDLSIGVLPTRRGPVADKEEAYLRHHRRIVEPSNFHARKTFNRDLPLYHNVTDLLACPCTLSASPTPSVLPIVTTLIRQARLRLSGIGNCVEFVLHANFFVTLVNAVALLTGSPLLISPTATVFELNVIIPILALACTYTASADIEPMKTIPSRHNYFVRLAIFRHSVVVWCLRYVPSLVALLVLGITCGTRMCNSSVAGLALSVSDACMISTRGYIALTMNYWLMIHSWTHLSRHHPLSPNFSFKARYGRRSSYLFKSFRWVFACVMSTVLSVIFVVVNTVGDGVALWAFYPSLAHFLISLLFPILLLLLDVPIKTWRLRRYTLMQKFQRLSFGTRLGMHSPRGDYEPEGVTFANASEEAVRHEDRNPTLKQRLHDVFYRFTTMKRGELELNCVCCDHIGGNYATYHVNGAVT
ncbi:uncharacterized protein Tco025E_03682 [Trypanosoma conorhini]|uniref:Transmembrane protein n=1 Tax=Trypanosoma conorhini TaxID=83891 RepID=A0A3R7LUD9_9TRYP|nr:uncharacterized protein Tco025E_03682 [Trypanosoma conorhini]RNF20924.1 hypothetical protein Tco025E_03682 [Trypanosoma conorhini]